MHKKCLEKLKSCEGYFMEIRCHFLSAMISLALILRKSKPGYGFSGSGEKLNHLLYMDDLKLYSKNEKELDSLIQTVRVFSQDIRMEFGIDKCATIVLKRGKSRME